MFILKSFDLLKDSSLKLDKLSSCKIYKDFSTISSTSPILQINPDFPLEISSGKPPASELTTGTDDAIASKADNPKLSFSDVNKNKSASDNTYSTSGTLQIKITARTFNGLALTKIKKKCAGVLY